MKKFIAVLFLLLVTSQSDSSDSEMVVSTALEKVQYLTRAEARNLYLLKTRVWKDGVRVVVLRLPSDHSVHKEFVRDILKMSDEQYNSEWNKLTNAGLLTTTETVLTPNEMLQVINRKHNAIGYISKDYLIINVGGYNVKVITIVD